MNALPKDLSGGEKVRLSLSVMSAITPMLLILDEITNNLDLETRQHVIEVLKEYPGAILGLGIGIDNWDESISPLKTRHYLYC